MGHLRKRTDRKGWYAIYRDGRNVRRQLHLPGNRRDAEAALQDLEVTAFHERQRFKDGAPGDAPLAEIHEAWWADVTARRRPATRENYAGAWRGFGDWLAAHAKSSGRPLKMAGELRPEDLRAFVTSRLAIGWTAASVNQRVSILRAMFRWAVDQQIIAESPFARWHALPKDATPARRALSDLEVARLLAASTEPWRTTWLVALGTGLRFGELAALQWTDLDLDAAQLTVRAEVAKSRKPRTVPLRRDLVDALRTLRRETPGRVAAARARLAALPEDAQDAERTRADALREAAETAVFLAPRGNRLRSTGNTWLQKAARSAGIFGRIDCHTLRHTFGSQLVSLGVDVRTVAELLGHSDAAITLRVYSHVVGDRKREAVDELRLVQAAAPRRRPRRRAV